MKYVRTKDRVYKVSHYNDWATHKRKGSTLVEKDRTSYIKNENIIKQADTIEELCDCFVIEWLPSNHKDIFTVDKYSKEVVKSCIGNNKTKVYGAIWTSKGLIYVAKMNDGELVLI